MAIAVIACDHVLYVVVVALCVFVGVECGWYCGCGFLGCLSVLGPWMVVTDASYVSPISVLLLLSHNALILLY